MQVDNFFRVKSSESEYKLYKNIKTNFLKKCFIMYGSSDLFVEILFPWSQLIGSDPVGQEGGQAINNFLNK